MEPLAFEALDPCLVIISLLWLQSSNSLEQSDLYVNDLKILLLVTDWGITDTKTVIILTFNSTLLIRIIIVLLNQ